MSNLDPFTQKLLERTQARKEAARLNRLNNAKNATPSVNPKSPFADKTNKNVVESPTKGKKRQSSEGLENTSIEKKSKENLVDERGENIFSQRQANKFVVPSNAGCTPKKVNCGSLSNRLASLNRDYEEKFAIDNAEIERRKEAERAKEERDREYKRQQEEERSKRIQQRIFGKTRDTTTTSSANKPVTMTTTKPRAQPSTTATATTQQQSLLSPKKNKAPKPPTDHSNDKENTTTAKRVAPKQPEITSPTKRKAPGTPTKSKPVATNTNNLMAKKQKDEEKELKERQRAAEQQYKQIQKERQDALEEEKKASASVGTKMSIFEEKMKQEKAAREKEIETENRLKKKTLRQPSSTSSQDEQVQTPTEDKKEVAFAVTTQQAKKPTPKKRVDLPTEEKETAKPADIPTPKKRKNVSIAPSPAPSTATPIKNFTGSINSPQPVDCTEDTAVSSSSDNVFDISAILKAAETEQQLSPPPDGAKNARPDARTPMRSSTMKVVNGATPVVPKPMFDIDIDLTPVHMEEPDESISEFAKQLRAKKNEIKILKAESAKKQKAPQKPPRNNTEFPPTYEEFVAAKKDGQIPLDVLITEPTNTNKPRNVEVREDPLHLKPEPKPRRKMRRSISFSEGTQKSPQKTPVKSGYNKYTSSKYDAIAAFDKPDMELTKKDMIQNLLEEAAYQQNIVLQASQALNVAECSNEDKRGSPEVLEGERLLLLATEKRTACLEEVRKLKEVDSDEFLNKGSNGDEPCHASLAISDIKLPLHPDFVSALRAGRQDLGIFHFCVLASCGHKNVFCTKVFSQHDDMEGQSLLIKDNLYLREVPNDFTLTLKVFGLHTKRNVDHLSKTKRLHSSGHQSPGNLKNLFSKRKDNDDVPSCASPQTVFRTSNLKLVGETKITLSLLGSGNKYLLTQVPANCPMDGTLSCRIGCRPEFSASSSGFLTIQEDIGGYTAWNRRWCTMKESQILYWRYPDDEDTKDPLGCIDLRYCTDKSVALLSRDKCARPNTFELNLKRALKPGDESNLVKTVDGKYAFIKVWICTDNKDDRITWMESLNKQISDSMAWNMRKTVNQKQSGSSKVKENVPILV